MLLFLLRDFAVLVLVSPSGFGGGIWIPSHVCNNLPKQAKVTQSEYLTLILGWDTELGCLSQGDTWLVNQFGQSLLNLPSPGRLRVTPVLCTGRSFVHPAVSVASGGCECVLFLGAVPVPTGPSL